MNELFASVRNSATIVMKLQLTGEKSLAVRLEEFRSYINGELREEKDCYIS